ncbi:alpha/beta hydrolase [Acuticoccus sediminis]|uniref:Alpha/beta hydrolase n=1 Tax=Acuticoccus sediminis TaxID=2184697 RepID=A0A8B2NWE7_9HYPH|nr:alpha/beta hydrolase fold domain-containing protein [Acuticoccus sediminis]RAI03693.1 alpha/beta hydrolase [Acuticoccus sediminis]
MDQRPTTLDDVRVRIGAHPVAGTPDARRVAFADLAGRQPQAERIRLGRTEALAIGEGPTLLWFHGGGFVFGSPESHAMMAMALAATGIRVILPRYRLAPEHAWPSMLDDAVEAATAAREDGPIVVGGVSAGGHLAIALARRHPYLAAGLAVLSPNTDRTGTDAARTAIAGDAMNDDETDAELATMALGNADRLDPDVSPAMADLSALPPTHVEVGGAEILLGDSLAFVEKATVDGVRVGLHLTPGLFHMAALWPDASVDARAQLGRLGAFTRITLTGA